MKRPFPSLLACCLVVLSVCVAGIVGCGDGDTVDVSGTVTFNGQPVPEGKIYFIPDGEKGNSGQTGYATISNGEYDTSDSDGKAASSGPVLVNIEGWDSNASGRQSKDDTSGEKTVKTLFPRYQTKADLTNPEGPQDFKVPPSAANDYSVGEKRNDGFIDP